MDISNEEAGPFFPGTTDKEAENTIAKGIAQAAAKRHIKGVINSTDGMFSMLERTTNANVAMTDTTEPVNADLMSPK